MNREQDWGIEPTTVDPPVRVPNRHERRATASLARKKAKPAKDRNASTKSRRRA